MVKRQSVHFSVSTESGKLDQGDDNPQTESLTSDR